MNCLYTRCFGGFVIIFYMQINVAKQLFYSILSNVCMVLNKNGVCACFQGQWL